MIWALWTQLHRLHSKLVHGIRPSFWKLKYHLMIPCRMRSFHFPHRQQIPNLWPPVKSMVCLGPLWALWVHWPPWKPSRCETIVVFNQGVGVQDVQDERWSKFLIFFLVHFFWSRDFWMISWSWSWCQVLVKDSALHKSCLRGKLLLFDPTSSLHPCRTVRIKRPELQFSFCWFLVFSFLFVLFRKLILKPFKCSMNPFRFKISTSFFSSQPVISSA